MFSFNYIIMCVKGQDEIQIIRTYPRFISGNQQPFFQFEERDVFHHPDMEPDEVREVIEIEKINLVTRDKKKYLKDECAWIPTVNQIINESKEKLIWSMDKDVAIGMYRGDFDTDEERVLAYFIENRTWSVWDSKIKEWMFMKDKILTYLKTKSPNPANIEEMERHFQLERAPLHRILLKFYRQDWITLRETGKAPNVFSLLMDIKLTDEGKKELPKTSTFTNN